MTHETSEVFLAQSHIEGTGVFAARAFQKGDSILAIDDSRAVTAGAPLRPELAEFDRHCDYLAGGRVVLMAIPERHINHACDPNTYVKTVDGVRRVIALRDIASGEELTFDYCINGYGDTLWQCSCGSPRCRKTLHSDFFHLPPSLQLDYLPLLDDWYVEEYREKVDRLLKNRA